MLDFSITDFKLSHGFSSKNGLINGHIGIFFNIFLCGLFCYVWLNSALSPVVYGDIALSINTYIT